MARRRWVAGIVLSLVFASAAPRAEAQAPLTTQSAVEGRVIEVQGSDLVLDLSASSGLRDGDRVQIWRPVVLRHPVTKKLLSDRFLIGELELVQVRPAMTLARAGAGLMRSPEVGDVVVLPQAVVPVAAPSVTSGAPSAGAPSPSACVGQAQTCPRVDVHAARVTALMRALQGAPPEKRARAYEKLAENDHGTPYADALRSEAEALRQIGAAQGASQPAARRGPPVPLALSGPLIAELREAEPVRIAVELANAHGAVLHVRAVGKPSFTSLPMEPMDHGYFGVTVPAAEVELPALEMFLEATDASGLAIAVLGSSDAPGRTNVRPAYVEEPPRSFLATVKLATDYADYNRLRGNDYAWQTEGEFGLRLADEGVRAVRSGFGVYRGKGGGVDELDRGGREPREIGLTYGYLEGELAPSHGFSIIPRVAVGLGDDGVTGGAQLLFRIGNDQETNLLLGGEALGGVGVRGIAQLELASFERVPILLRTEVTNQPAGASGSSGDFDPNNPQPIATELGDVGARGIAEIGYRVVDQLVLRVRGSFQGRTIQHAGPGFGGGVSYSW